MPTSQPHGLYVHVPFCRVRCAYCDFAIVPGGAGGAGAWADALVREMEGVARRLGARALDTVYLGGGTPSLVPPPLVGAVLAAARGAFAVAAAPSVSLEANPEDVSEAAAAAWREAGVTRITVGLQALTEEGLAAIGRPGSARDGPRAIDAARAAGIGSVGADVIFGRPGQALASWREELARLTDVDLDHVSCYALETTSRTPLVHAIERGEVAAPDPDVQADMYEEAVSALAAGGLRRYEISNFARPGHESLHNLKYWTDEPYVGLGPSAASYVDGERWTSPRRLSDWLRHAKSGWGGASPEPYDARRRAGEALALGLRLDRGVELARVAERHGEPALAAHAPALERGARDGIVVMRGGTVALTDRGRLIADELFVHLM